MEIPEVHITQNHLQIVLGLNPNAESIQLGIDVEAVQRHHHHVQGRGGRCLLKHAL